MDFPLRTCDVRIYSHLNTATCKVFVDRPLTLFTTYPQLPLYSAFGDSDSNLITTAYIERLIELWEIGSDPNFPMTLAGYFPLPDTLQSSTSLEFLNS